MLSFVQHRDSSLSNVKKQLFEAHYWVATAFAMFLKNIQKIFGVFIREWDLQKKKKQKTKGAIKTLNCQITAYPKLDSGLYGKVILILWVLCLNVV